MKFSFGFLFCCCTALLMIPEFGSAEKYTILLKACSAFQYEFVTGGRTPNKVIYTASNDYYENWFPAPKSKTLNFQIMAKAFKISLASYPANDSPNIEFGICQPSGSKIAVIWRDNKNVTSLTIDSKYIPNERKFTGYWLTWLNNNVKIGEKGETEEFLLFDDPDPFPIEYIGITTLDSNKHGVWILENNKNIIT